MTTRSFSRYCGKSEGYYGSISAQNLPISTNSLLYLSEVLEHKKAEHPNKYINELQTVNRGGLRSVSPAALTQAKRGIAS